MTSWNACMGRASKNSCATMKGTLSEPARGQHHSLTSYNTCPVFWARTLGD